MKNGSGSNRVYLDTYGFRLNGSNGPLVNIYEITGLGGAISVRDNNNKTRADIDNNGAYRIYNSAGS